MTDLHDMARAVLDDFYSVLDDPDSTELAKLQATTDAVAGIDGYDEDGRIRDAVSNYAIGTKLPADKVQRAIVGGLERAQVAREHRDKRPPLRLNGAGIHQDANGSLREPPANDEPIEPLEMFDAGDWEGQAIVPRQWITPDQIPGGEPGILSGDGGTGKTMIALQLGCSIAAEWQDWLSKIVEMHGPVILYSVEEKLTEFHRRTSWVLESRKAPFSILRKRFFFIGDRKDETILGRADRNGLVLPTRTLLRLEKSVALIKPALVVVENAADVFAGNENDRAQVHTFVRGLLGGLCTTGATMMLLQHPSVTGLTDGTGRAGTTGWNNAGRWRLNFKTAKQDDDNGVDDGRRQLVTVKANYGRRGEKISVEWRDGIFVPQGSQSSPQRAAADAQIDDAFMRCLDAATAQGRTVSDGNGRNYAPRRFAEMAEAGGIGKRALELAMERGFSAGRIKIETKGAAHHQKRRIVKV
jgi:RecA-family ATPase